jgi:diguanylate cyclase (GGDEF)-like protein/PAS domain S-box-containing protein
MNKAWFSVLKEWFTLSHTYKQEEDRRMARILLTMILVYLAVSLIVMLLDLAWGDGSLMVFLVTGDVLQILPLAMLSKGKLSASSYIATGIFIGFTTLFATTGHGIHDYIIITYPAIIMFAGLTNQRRGLVVSTLLTLASLVWLVLGEINGWFVVRKTYVPDLVDLVAICLLVVIAATAVHLLVSNLEYGLAQTWRELANRQRVEEELRKNHEDFKRYFNMGTVGMAVTLPEKGWVEVNDRLCQMFGYSREEMTKMTWADLTHPDDLDANLRLFNQMLSGEINSFQLDKRYIRKDGSVVYTTIFASCHRHPDGTVRHLLTSVIDITERKRAEQSLYEAQSLLHLLGDNLEEAALYVYAHDDKGEPHFEYLSAGMEKLTGVTTEQALQDASTLHNTILPEYISQLVEMEKKSKESLKSFEMEICQRHVISGEIRWALLRSTPRRRPDGSTVWYGVQMDITERKRNEKLLEEANDQLRIHLLEIEQLHEELSEQAIRDPLTGLFNRRYMQDVFRQEFSRARRENYPVSVIMLDMDELKVLNDTYGHNLGDQALQSFAFHLQTMTRKEDIVCRYGGDEFAVILSKAFPKDAAKRVEEWREALNNHPLETEGENKVWIKFTAGIASFPAHGDTLEEIINYADVALYRAKARGRNCTSVFGASGG